MFSHQSKVQPYLSKALLSLCLLVTVLTRRAALKIRIAFDAV